MLIAVSHIHFTSSLTSQPLFLIATQCWFVIKIKMIQEYKSLSLASLLPSQPNVCLPNLNHWALVILKPIALECIFPGPPTIFAELNNFMHLMSSIWIYFEVLLDVRQCRGWDSKPMNHISRFPNLMRLAQSVYLTVYWDRTSFKNSTTMLWMSCCWIFFLYEFIVHIKIEV